MSDSKAGAVELEGVPFMCWCCPFVVDYCEKGKQRAHLQTAEGTISYRLRGAHPSSQLRSLGIFILPTKDFISHHSLQPTTPEASPEQRPPSTAESTTVPWVTTLVVSNPCYWNSAFLFSPLSSAIASTDPMWIFWCLILVSPPLLPESNGDQPGRTCS